MIKICLILGILCILYCLAILLSGAYGSWFFLIWAAAGICLLGLAWGMHHHVWALLPALLRRVLLWGTLAAAVFFLLIEALILSGFSEKGEPGLDYLIVLGAQVWPSGPSKALRYRLDAAYDYLMENPDTAVIVSGGQGYNEPFTEAQGMYDYLTAKGLDASRIRMEDKSTSTYENLKFSAELMGSREKKVGIVTNNFHVYRSIQLAKAQGYTNICGISAPSNLAFQPNNMLREFFGVVKNWVWGNMALW